MSFLLVAAASLAFLLPSAEPLSRSLDPAIKHFANGKVPTRVLHVDVGAKAGGTGTAARPFQRIRDAIAKASPGTGVRIHPGTYPGGTWVLYSRFQRCGGGGSDSGVDHVGCHRGLLAGNRFEDLSVSAIQCKGGSEDIEIRANTLIRPGARGINLGGATGFQYFRPPLSKTKTFQIANNLWYAHDQPSASKPQLPVTESAGIHGKDPGIRPRKDYSIKRSSPAAGKGTPFKRVPERDHGWRGYRKVPSIGAYEIH